MKNHSRNLHAPLCGIFCPLSVGVARYAALNRTKSPTNCVAHLAESLFQTRSSAKSPYSFCSHVMRNHSLSQRSSYTTLYHQNSINHFLSPSSYCK
ncbi:hypothetical protein DXA17_04020 [Ruminococcus sp. AM58-7XD]|nr:hypothetical protein DXA17_04020 [Ruminococcus sp. AM58-7XD]